MSDTPTPLEAFRKLIETYIESISPNLVADHDSMVTTYKAGLADLGLDLSDDVSLFAYGLGLQTLSSLIVTLTEEQCQAGAVHVQHVAQHVRTATLRLGLVWRDAMRTRDLEIGALAALDFEPTTEADASTD